MYLLRQFQLKHSIRFTSQLVNPPVAHADEFMLPIGSIYHYTDYDVDVFGQDDIFLSKLHSKYVVVNAPQIDLDSYSYLDHLRTKRHVVNFRSADIQFYQTHPDILRYSAYQERLVREPRTALVVNYQMTEKHIEFIDTPYTDYYLNHIRTRTIMQNLIKYDVPNRQHYIAIRVPLNMPGRQLLARWTETKAITPVLAHQLADPDVYWLYQIWLMIDRDVQGCFNLLADKDILNRVNLIIFTGNKWTSLNIGQFLGWLKDDSKKDGWDSEVARRKFLILYLRLSEIPDEISDDEDLDVIGQPVDADNDGEDLPDQYTGLHNTKGNLIAKNLVKAITTDDDAYVTDESVDDDTAEVPVDTEADIEARLLKELDSKDAQNEEATVATTEPEAAVVTYTPFVTPEQTAITDEVDRLSTDLHRRGVFTEKEVNRHKTLSRKYTTLKSPYDQGLLKDFIQIKPEDKVIESTNPITENYTKLVTDKTMTSCSLQKFDRQYISKTLNKDVVRCALAVQQAGVSVTDYKVNRYTTLHDDYEIHSLKIIPVVGAESTINFKVPVVREDGTFLSSGVRYRMRKQWGDLPIRKVDRFKVALTSYYSKLFVIRSERMTNNYDAWLLRNFNIGMSDDKRITAIRYRNCFNQTEKLPRDYTIMSTLVSSFMLDGFMYNFDFARIEKVFPKAPKTSAGEVVVAVSAKFDHIVMTKQNWLVKIDSKGERTELGRLGFLFNPDTNAPPSPMAELNILGKTIPLGLVLGRYIGLGRLLETLKISYRRLPRHTRNVDIKADEDALYFQDEILIYSTTKPEAALLLSGFDRAHSYIKHHSVYQFDKSDVYGVVLDGLNVTSRHTREMDLMLKMWVDPITKSLLEEMKEPTDLIGLLIRSVELLGDDRHLDEFDLQGMRIRGYDRFAGLMYTNLVASARGFHIRPNNPKNALSINPEQVWYALLQDQSVAPVDESNPMQSLKDQEIIIYSGAGGRSGDTMSAKTRGYHKSAIGVISEATVDSGDAGTTVYLTADPTINSVYGTTSKSKGGDTVNAKGISSSFLNAPGLEYDDGKRLNFTGVQNSQTTLLLHPQSLPCRTGYESMIGFRAGTLYANYAKGAGEVVSVSKHAVQVKYGNEVVAYPVGVIYGRWSGKTIPHVLVSAVKVGDKVNDQQVISYNKHYFMLDPIAPEHLIMRWGRLARVAFLDNRDTNEDGSAFSREFADKMASMTTHIRDVLVDAAYGVTGLLKIGTDVAVDTILCQLNPAQEAGIPLGQNTLDTLKRVAGLSPKAKFEGHIEQIEVLYTCEPDMLSDSLKDIVDEADSRLINRKRQLKEPLADGRVPVGFRVGSKVLGDNQVLIRVYITEVIPYRDGDKAVVGHQLKSVTGHIVEEGFWDEHGRPIDVLFGGRSWGARIVGSMTSIGGVGAIMATITERMVASYRGRE